ncbi:hypothetical protein HNP38_002169 [Chryseobacterium defluvii]|uniref:Uncharacterized protein n=1 Tax=Chryseobacterium defluvii TaxID=160396 RepID=A0A840KH79_9FLAO|nr:hypothetical protein [Chryseobacterium defluvii]MBB4806873.1 hypothetical protein [Chryseobacterium defluvii]
MSINVCYSQRPGAGDPALAVAANQMLNYTTNVSFDMYKYTLDKTTRDQYESNPLFENNVYRYEDFTIARISNIKDPKLIRYNLVNDEVEVKMKDNVYAVDKNDMYNEFLIEKTGERIRFLPYIDKNGTETKGYLFEVYSDKDFTLYKKIYSKFIEPKELKSGFETQKPFGFINQEPLYFFASTYTDKINYLPEKKNKLASLFPEKDEKIRKIIRESKVSFSDQRSIINLLKEIHNH